jgi:cation diffusion facilitator CzcD-associated flavoprotein CzcO
MQNLGNRDGSKHFPGVGMPPRAATLQWLPTYRVARPSVDVATDWIRRLLPVRLALGVSRWKNILLGMHLYNRSRRRPDLVRQENLRLVREHLSPKNDVEKHLMPRYNRRDQRLCVALDGDFFAAIRSRKASVVTD